MSSGDVWSSLQGHPVRDKRGRSGSSVHHVWTVTTRQKEPFRCSFMASLQKSLWCLWVNMRVNVNDLWLGYTRRSFKTMKTCDGPQKPNNQASFLSTAENTSYYYMMLPLCIRKMYSFWIFTKYWMNSLPGWDLNILNKQISLILFLPKSFQVKLKSEMKYYLSC